MKQLPVYMLCTAVTAAMMVELTSSCVRDPLYYISQTPVRVVVNMDWSNLGSQPEGASIYFYPEGEGQSYSFTTNSTASTMVMVPSGWYTEMVFNRTPEEYGTMSFLNMLSVEDARAVLDFKYSAWTGTADTVGRTVYEPEDIVSGRTDRFYVHDIIESVHDTLVPWGYRCDTVLVTPQQFVMNGRVKVRTYGINNVRSVRAYLTGMAGDTYIVPRTTGDSLCTHTLDSWSISCDAYDYTKGYLVSEFKCFGLPDTYREERYAKNNLLHVEVLLVDNKTTVKKDWDVGELIQEDFDELLVSLVVELLELPDVKPEGGTESGFDVNIEDWGDGEDIEVPL